MPSYVILGKWTDQGIKSVKDTLNRSQRFREMVQQAGGSVTAQVWTQGAYDVVAIAELPDDDSATAVALQLGGTGNIRTETLRAYSADDVKRILGKLP
jgi:uncharacterized protein with GYD domain